MWDGGSEGLGTKIGGGIDDDAEGAFFNPNGGAKSAIAWSGEVQTRQEQVRRGTPWEVPVPKKVRRIDSDSVGWGVWRTCIGVGRAG